MEDNTTTAPPAENTVAPLSFTEKLTNIFASPGELFDNVRDTPPTSSNWLIPLIIFIVVAIVMGQVVMHNPSLLDQIKAQIQQTMDKKFQEAIQQGQMSPQQADQAREMAEKYSDPSSLLSTIIQMVAIAIVSPITLFFVALVYWLLGKYTMKADAPYMKIVEVVGLTLFIGALQAIVTVITKIVTDNYNATPSLMLAVLGQFSPENKLHIALSKVDLFEIWSLIVTSIGLSRLFRRDLAKVMVLVFALWILWVVLLVITGWRIGG